MVACAVIADLSSVLVCSKSKLLETQSGDHLVVAGSARGGGLLELRAVHSRALLTRATGRTLAQHHTTRVQHQCCAADYSTTVLYPYLRVHNK